MLRPAPFQGAGAFCRRGPRGVHVVQQQDLRGGLSPPGTGERSPDVGRPEGKRKTRLRGSLPGSTKEEGGERPARAAGQGASDQRGEVEPAPEIFPGMDRNRDDRGADGVRNEVRPLLAKSPEEAVREGVGRQRNAAVFRRPDRVPDLLPVGEQGAGRGEGGIVRAVGAGRPPVRLRRKQDGGEGAAEGAGGSSPGGPLPDRVSGETGGFAGDQRPEGRDFRGERPDQPAKGGRLNGSWPGWRTPCVRGRWRTRSRFRRRDTGRST